MLAGMKVDVLTSCIAEAVVLSRESCPRSAARTLGSRWNLRAWHWDCVEVVEMTVLPCSVVNGERYDESISCTLSGSQ